MRNAIATAMLFGSAVVCIAQQADDSKFTFEAAVVKQAPPDDGRNMVIVKGGPCTKDPERLTFENVTLGNLLRRAWPDSYRVEGPVWLDTDKYSVIAKVPPGATKEQEPSMFRNLIEEEFGLKVHHETRVFPIYELVVAKGGPKLKATVESSDALAVAPNSGAPRLDAEGFPQLDRPGMITMNTYRKDGVPIARTTAKGQPISRLVGMLSVATQRRVEDKTGLDGKYDFNLEYAPGGAMATTSPSADAGQAELEAPTILYAIKSLGLTLEDAKKSLDVLIVDHVEKVPASN